MNGPLLFAAALALAGGGVHSYMGERVILAPLFRDARIPETPFGDAQFTKAMIRGVWHFFAVVVWSTAGVFFAVSAGLFDGGTPLRVIAVYWALFAVVALVLSRGRHFA